MDTNTPSNKKSYFVACIPKIITGFSIVALGILLFFIIFKINIILGLFGKIMGILQPIIYGLAIAYLINPVVTKSENFLLKICSKFFKTGNKTKKAIKFICIFLGMAIFIFTVSIIFILVVPELIKSISGFITDFPENFAVFRLWLTKRMEHHPEIVSAISQNLENAMQYFESYFETQILPKLNTYIGQFTNIILGTLNVIKNLIIGLIVTVYALNSKDTFKGEFKKLIYAILKPQQADTFLDTARHSHSIFSGFISGKIIDSLIIGVLCFIILSILKMPYTLLVSVIVGITNVIPFFGPYIGAIPSAILILIVNPIQGLHFIIFIIILQQFDGNILGPKILGDSTGLSAFWVLFSILLGGGLFGIIGMILGVPTFAVIYYLAKTYIESTLKKKQLPTETAAYIDVENSECLADKADNDKE